MPAERRLPPGQGECPPRCWRVLSGDTRGVAVWSGQGELAYPSGHPFAWHSLHMFDMVNATIRTPRDQAFPLSGGALGHTLVLGGFPARTTRLVDAGRLVPQVNGAPIVTDLLTPQAMAEINAAINTGAHPCGCCGDAVYSIALLCGECQEADCLPTTDGSGETGYTTCLRTDCGCGDPRTADYYFSVVYIRPDGETDYSDGYACDEHMINDASDAPGVLCPPDADVLEFEFSPLHVEGR